MSGADHRTEEKNGRERRQLPGGVRVELVRGAHGGSTLWIWVPAGARAPSMVQAAAELRDRLDPARLHGTVGFLLDGPAVREVDAGAPMGRAAAAVRELTGGAAGVLALFE